MKKKIYTFAIALAFSACGGGSLSKIVIDEDSTTDITFFPRDILNNFITIKQGSYPVKYENNLLCFTIKFVVAEKKWINNYLLDEFIAKDDKEENKIKGVTFEAVDAETKYNELKSASKDDVVEVTFAYKKGSEEEMKTIGSQINYIMADLSIMERD